MQKIDSMKLLPIKKLRLFFGFCWKFINFAHSETLKTFCLWHKKENRRYKTYKIRALAFVLLFENLDNSRIDEE